MELRIENNTVPNIGTTPVQILQTINFQKITVIGLSMTNTQTSNLFINLILENTDTNTTVYYLKETIVASGTSLRAVSNGEKLILSPNNILYAQSSLANSIDVIVSYVQG